MTKSGGWQTVLVLHDKILCCGFIISERDVTKSLVKANSNICLSLANSNQYLYLFSFLSLPKCLRHFGCWWKMFFTILGLGFFSFNGSIVRPCSEFRRIFSMRNGSLPAWCSLFHLAWITTSPLTLSILWKRKQTNKQESMERNSSILFYLSQGACKDSSRGKLWQVPATYRNSRRNKINSELKLSGTWGKKEVYLYLSSSISPVIDF